ncbi:MAG: cytidine deaminase [Flavobacteriales bacterium]|nr:cytidine deaminase [Flavobacteriales bacterium]
MKIKVESEITVFEENQLADDKRELITHAEKAINNAYYPYSGFGVGAAIRLKSGKIVIGNNQENAAFPSGLCAERVAAFAVKAQFPNDDITEIAIAIKPSKPVEFDFAPPCGACLQVLSDIETRQKNKISILIKGKMGRIYTTYSTKAFLPFSFEF